MSDGGKGSKPRPFSISHDEWTKRWDAIFARDLEDVENNTNLKEDNAENLKRESSTSDRKQI